MLSIENMLLSLPKVGGESNGWVLKYTNAWGISKNSLNNQFKNFIGKGFDSKRKKRSDVGTSIFNCEKKRKHAFTDTEVDALTALAERDLIRSRTLWDELKDILLLSINKQWEDNLYGLIRFVCSQLVLIQLIITHTTKAISGKRCTLW